MSEIHNKPLAYKKTNHYFLSETKQKVFKMMLR